ncbi:MAG: aminotransferase class V-fold PLP-dependent enzyme [Planctomycetota bacterium]
MDSPALSPNSPTGSPQASRLTPDTMRAQMPISRRIAYFDHAAVAPLSGPASTALSHWSQQAAELGDTVWLDWNEGVERTRQSAATLIGADTDEVALVANTTTGINFVAEGLDWRTGDNVVILGDEYPSNVYPWMHQQDRGVETRFVETDFGRLDPDKLRQACDSRTRVVSVSWSGFSTGYRHDIDRLVEIAHAAGALFFLDAIQGLGVFPLDVTQTPVDFLAADGHKWMLGPEGAGLAYIRGEHLDRLRTIGVGATSVVGRYDYSTIDYRLRNCAARYEGGSHNMAGFIGWGASLELLAQWAPGELATAVLAISDLAVERLQSAGAEVLTHRRLGPDGHDPRSGIVAFTVPGQDPMEARKRCLEAGIALSCRGGRLRISPHGYNNADDVDRLIDALFH